MLLPLVLFIFPALFVVVLLPSLLALMKNFKM
jgi:pilus assembly protein TadC